MMKFHQFFLDMDNHMLIKVLFINYISFKNMKEEECLDMCPI